MGRGRQKAKHTKVARDLKYFSPDTNYSALQEELGTSSRLEEDLEKWPEYSADDDDEFDESDEYDAENETKSA